MPRVMLALALCASAAACRHQNPYEYKKEYQALAAKSLKPAELERGEGRGSWRAFRMFRVRVYADAAFVKREGNLHTFAEEHIARANQLLEPLLRLRLVLTDTRELPEQSVQADMAATHAALVELDRAEDVDLVVAYVGVSPVSTLSFHELGRASMLGRHIVLRAMDDAAELRTLAEGLDTLSVEDRSRLYQQRKHHKENAILLHEIGHVLGAIHVGDHEDLMHPSYDHTMQRFSGPNLELMGFAIEQRVATAEAQDFAGLVQRLKDTIAGSDYKGWLADDRKLYLDALERASSAPGGSSQPVPEAAASASSKPAQKPAVAADLAMLSLPDRARYAELEAHVNAHHVREAYLVARELAPRYPQCFALQAKACELGMQLSRDYRELQSFCERMTPPAANPAAAP